MDGVFEEVVGDGNLLTQEGYRGVSGSDGGIIDGNEDSEMTTYGDIRPARDVVWLVFFDVFSSRIALLTFIF